MLLQARGLAARAGDILRRGLPAYQSPSRVGDILRRVLRAYHSPSRVGDIDRPGTTVPSPAVRAIKDRRHHLPVHPAASEKRHSSAAVVGWLEFTTSETRGDGHVAIAVGVE